MASQDWFDKDFYAILGVPKDVTPEALKKAYRKLARSYHPDSNPGDSAAESRFKEISEAHSVLSNPEERAEYDKIRAMGSGARFTASGAGQPGGFDDVFGDVFGGSGQRVRFERGGSPAAGGRDFDDIFGLFGSGGFGTSSGGFRGYGGPTRGRDITATTTIDFLTATKGETVTLQTANGKPITVKIPAGVADKQKVRIRGRGEPSSDGGEPGDIVLVVTVRKHPVFERDGLDLRLSLPVTFVEATLGATVDVPTLGGKPVKVRIAAGTPSGRALRVKGRGVATAKGTGDLLAIVTIAVPSHVTDEAKVALSNFAKVLPMDDPRADLVDRAKG